MKAMTDLTCIKLLAIIPAVMWTASAASQELNSGPSLASPNATPYVYLSPVVSPKLSWFDLRWPLNSPTDIAQDWQPNWFFVGLAAGIPDAQRAIGSEGWPFNAALSNDSYSSLTARLGVVHDKASLFLTGGIGSLRYQGNYLGLSGFSSPSKWSVGAGFEYALTPTMTFRATYERAERYDFTSPSTSTFSDQTILAGLSWNGDWWRRIFWPTPKDDKETPHNLAPTSCARSPWQCGNLP